MLELSQINQSKILISPLDWGFGHTTRCVALIKTLLAQNNKITFAGNSAQIDFISNEFKDIKTVYIEGYCVKLNTKKSVYIQLLKQLFGVFKAIKKENKWVKNFTNNNKIDYIISDNRYGFFSKHISSIILTHQLTLQIPYGKKVINKYLKSKIEKFDMCWIPDDSSHKYAGELSQHQLSIPFEYIGILNRFNKLKTADYKYDYLFIISGPSPEREHFYMNVLKTVKQSNYKVAIVGTLSFENSINNKEINFFNSPSTKDMELIISQSKCVIGKSGYTSIMELISLNKLFWLFPSKYQYEQIYLSKWHKTMSNITDLPDEFRFLNK